MARLSTYTKDLNLTGKDMLAGSNYITTVNGIDQFETNNFTLAKITEYINGQIITDPSVLSLKANGGLVYETVNSTNYLAVDLSATNITGQLANSDLVNSTITINGTSVALGGSITIGEVSEVIAGTYLNGGGTEGVVTLNHDLTTRTDTTSSITPAHETSFTVIDALSTNSTGHVTGTNTKTVTLPSDTTYTIEAIDSSNDALIRLIGSNSTTDDIKLKAGSNIVINVNESTDEIEIAGTAFGNVYTVASEAAMIAATSTAGDLVVRTDVSKTFIHNGGTTGTAADFTELQFSGIQQIDLVAGDGIDLEDHANNPITTLTQSANDLKVINTLATASERGGIQIGYTENGKNYPVELSSEKAYVNVPWTDENDYVDSLTVTGTTTKTITLGRTGALPDLTANFDDIDNYVDSITVTEPTSTTKRITIGRTGSLADLTADFTDNNTIPNNATITLSAGTYISGGGDFTTDQSSAETITFNHDNTTRTNTTSSVSPAHEASFTAIDTITTNATGHITAVNTKTITLPADLSQQTFWRAQDDDGDYKDVAHSEYLKFVVSTTAGTPGTNITGSGISSDPYLLTITTQNTDTTNWNWQVDTNTATNVSAGQTVTLISGGAISIGTSGRNAIINHADTSSQGSVNNSGRTYIQDITLDTYGHVTGLTSATETVVDTNNYVTSANVTGTTTKTLTLTRQGLSDLTATWTDIDTNTDNYVTGASVTGTTTKTLTLTRSGGLGNLTATWTDIDTNTDTNYYLNTASFNTGDGVLSLGVTGYGTVTVDLDGRYLTSYTETSTLANVVSRGNSTNGTLEVTGSGAWLTVEGNTGGTTPPLNYGLGFGWNRSNGSNETEILFRSSSAGHNGSLRIVSFDGSTYRTLAKMYGNEAIEFTNAGDINAEHQSTRYLRRAYDSSRYSQLESNSTGGALYMQHVGNSIYLKSYDDCYFANAGQVGFGTTSPTYPIHVTNQVSNTSIYASYDIVAYSDERVKEDIQVIPNALEKVSNIRGVTFKRKDADNENRMAGVIAQEIEKVLPEVVKEDKDGNKAVAYGNVVSLLIEAIKELSDKVKALENGSTK